MVQAGSMPHYWMKCGRNHTSFCCDGSIGCLKCGQTMHFTRECQKKNQGNGIGGNRAMSLLISPQDRVAPRGATSGTNEGTNCLYALNNRKEHENLQNIVTSMIQVFEFIIYALLDSIASLSFQTAYIALNFEIIHKNHSEPFSDSTTVGESILTDRVYRSCLVSINHKSTMGVLVELDMVYFDVILCMD